MSTAGCLRTGSSTSSPQDSSKSLPGGTGGYVSGAGEGVTEHIQGNRPGWLGVEGEARRALSVLPPHRLAGSSTRRATDDGTAIRRRRSCPECGRRFTTVETAALAVVKRSGVTEPFSRAKVVAGVRKACQGRPVDEDALALLAQRVEETVRATRLPPRSRATRSGWPSSRRCATSTRSPTCGSRRVYRASIRSRTSRPRSRCYVPNATCSRAKRRRTKAADAQTENDPGRGTHPAAGTWCLLISERTIRMTETS